MRVQSTTHCQEHHGHHQRHKVHIVPAAQQADSQPTASTARDWWLTQWGDARLLSSVLGSSRHSTAHIPARAAAAAAVRTHWSCCTAARGLQASGGISFSNCRTIMFSVNGDCCWWSGISSFSRPILYASRTITVSSATRSNTADATMLSLQQTHSCGAVAGASCLRPLQHSGPPNELGAAAAVVIQHQGAISIRGERLYCKQQGPAFVNHQSWA